MHKSRNLTSHAYDSLTTEGIASEIRNEYVSLLNDLKEVILKQSDFEENSLFS